MISNLQAKVEDGKQDIYPDLLIGLVGKGIKRSRTPCMHMSEGSAQGQRIIYKILDVDQDFRREKSLAATIEAAEFFGFAGLNVTYPFKVDILPLLDQISENAQKIGAVNTVVFRDGKRIGHNTDKWGFEEGFRQNMSGVDLDHVLLIGSGGAGVAVAHALAALGVRRLTIADKDNARAENLKNKIVKNSAGTAVDVICLDDISTLAPSGVVNATPVGMKIHTGSAYPLHLLHPDMWIADIVYFPLETELLSAARSVGCRVLPGSGMAVYQAVRAYELFTGRKPLPMRMKATFESFTS